MPTGRLDGTPQLRDRRRRWHARFNIDRHGEQRALTTVRTLQEYRAGLVELGVDPAHVKAVAVGLEKLLNGWQTD